MITIDEYHVPVVAPYLGGWGVYCLACSAQADDYVYSCKLRRGWPPRYLVAKENE